MTVLRADARALPRFRTIVADPPWEYESRTYGEDGGWCSVDFAVGRHQYSTLALGQICALPVSLFVGDAAFLWLWIPSEQFRAGWHEAVMTAWGFTFRRERIWCKEESGVGFWFVTNHEYLTLGTRGAVGREMKRGLPSAVYEPRNGRHTTKPERFYREIEDACPGPYLELFARRPRPEQLDMTRPNVEWTVWGNEVGDPLGIGFDPEGWAAHTPEKQEVL